VLRVGRPAPFAGLARLWPPLLAVSTIAVAAYPRAPQIGPSGIDVVLADFAPAPLSSRTRREYPPQLDPSNLLNRVSVLRSEPPDAPLSSARFFVSDLNRTLYILDKTTRTFTPYINFEEVFPAFSNRTSYGVGFGNFVFDPGYARNGRFFTVHSETTQRDAVPTNAKLPGLNLAAGYVAAPPIDPPEGTVLRRSVVIEWTDTDLSNARFEGSAREVLRVGFNTNSHPVADLLFNPNARPGTEDYGNLYLSAGDDGTVLPQRLDALPGKVLRITPDITLRPADELSSSGRYRIPTSGSDPNPFLSVRLPNARREIFAYGLRNPQRMSWDPVSNAILVADMGEGSWEEVNLLKKGANYGFAAREGNEVLFVGGRNHFKTGGQVSPPELLPRPDVLPVAGLPGPIAPEYPVALYSHFDGDAICGGFVYSGSRMPLLTGKYIFGDVSTGRLFVADLADIEAADDGRPETVADIRELQVLFDESASDHPERPVARRLFDIAHDAYVRRGGRTRGAALPDGRPEHLTNLRDSRGVAYGGGRVDIRLSVDGAGELYVLSKSDGMIRTLVSARVAASPGPGEERSAP